MQSRIGLVNAWFKQRPWWHYVSTLGSALLFALAVGAVARRNKQSDRLHHQAEQNAATGATRALERATRQTVRAENHKIKATEAAHLAAIQLDTIGANDATISDLVNDWNAGRLRRGSG